MTRPPDYDCWRWRPTAEPPSECRLVLAETTSGYGLTLYGGGYPAYGGYGQPALLRWRDLPDALADAEIEALRERVAELSTPRWFTSTYDRAYELLVGSACVASVWRPNYCHRAHAWTWETDGKGSGKCRSLVAAKRAAEMAALGRTL